MMPPPGSLLAFHAWIFPTYSGGQPYTPRWFDGAICAYLEAVTRGEIRQGIINAPPSLGKSSICSVTWPMWVHSFDPGVQFVVASYETSIGERLASAYRSGVTSEEWVARYGALLPTASRLDELSNLHGGYRITTTPLSKLTSLHPKFLIVDDGQRPGESVEKEIAVFEWFRKVTPSRVIAKGGARLVLMQRVSLGDLSGRLLEAYPGEWKTLVLPLRRWAENVDPADPRPNAGDLLALDERTAAALERELGRDASSQLDQRPVPLEGGIIRVGWCQNRYDVAPNLDECSQVVIAVDLAVVAKSSSDFSVWQVWARKDAQRFLLKEVRERVEFPEQCRITASLAAEYPRAGVYVEAKANGSAVVAQLKQTVPRLVPDDPGRDSKAVRLAATSPLWEAGNIRLPSARLAPWIDDYVAELTSMTMTGAGRFDDRCDATSLALKRLDSGASDLEVAMRRFRAAGGSASSIFGGFRPW